MVACTKDLQEGKFFPKLKCDTTEIFWALNGIGVCDKIYRWLRITNNRKIQMNAVFSDFDLARAKDHINYMITAPTDRKFFYALPNFSDESRYPHIQAQLHNALVGKDYSFKHQDLIAVQILMNQVLRGIFNAHYLQCGFLKNDDDTYQIVIFFETTFNRGYNPIIFFYGTL